MLAFMQQNMATILISAVVFGLVAAVAIKMIKDRRKGASGCGCGCDRCPSARSCHTAKQPNG